MRAQEWEETESKKGKKKEWQERQNEEESNELRKCHPWKKEGERGSAPLVHVR